jgi:2-methylisocitrate lyase-like PEP mutase family enzyme
VTFAELHGRQQPLLLPNAWDVPSALAFYDAGFPAIGTTSFGLAAGAGRPDGGRSSRESTAMLIEQLRTLNVFLSADIEDGYDDDPEAVATTVASLGIAGVNIEDSTNELLISPKVHAAKVNAIKRRTPEVFVNARVDTYWLHQSATVEATLERARVYVDAGADGIFIPGASDPDDLRALTAAIAVPVNVLATAGLSLDDMGRLGVRRVSTGSLPYRAALHAAVRAAQAARDGDDLPLSIPYPDMQSQLRNFAQLRHA